MPMNTATGGHSDTELPVGKTWRTPASLHRGQQVMNREVARPARDAEHEQINLTNKPKDSLRV